MASLILCIFRQFSNSSHRLKIKIFECWCFRLYLHYLCIQKLGTGIFECCPKLDFPIFPNSWKRWKDEIFKRWPIGSTYKFFQILKEIENWHDWAECWKGIIKWARRNKPWKLNCAAKLSLAKGTKLCFGFVGGFIILIQVLVGSIIIGDLQIILKRFLKKVFEISFQEKKFKLL